VFRSGNVTVFVSNMDRAVHFYTDVLGLKLVYRFGDDWASVEVGKGLTIGLHPLSAKAQAGGSGGMSIGLELSGKIEDAIDKLKSKGVHFGEIIDDDKAGRFAHFHDPDGNSLYLAQLDWGHVSQGEGHYQQG
jgi:catechol 2,3-dioxygenase-like lactoylglutathione lyase family enzyme